MIKIVWVFVFALFGYVAIVVLACAFLLWASIRLDQYLKIHDYKCWRDLNSFGNGRLVGFVNHEKYRRFIKSKEGESDTKFLKLKDSVRIWLRFFRLAVIGMLAHILLFIAFVLYLKSKEFI